MTMKMKIRADTYKKIATATATATEFTLQKAKRRNSPRKSQRKDTIDTHQETQKQETNSLFAQSESEK
jgi:hypothetical protein